MDDGDDPELAGTLTRLIDQIDAGNAGARNEFCAQVYEALRRIGRHACRRPYDSWAATDVVNEFFGHILADGRLGQMKNRRYFYAAAADQMRRLLIDHWRHKRTLREGGQMHREQLDPWLDALAESAAERGGGDLEALDGALAQLKIDRPRQHEIVQLKFFAGLTNEQIAEALDVSLDTVKRDWRAARARLGARLSVDA
jgi:RNA polymerase sigma factor (TIGR02999 family)